MIPFLCSVLGGSQLRKTERGLLATAITLRGGPLGTGKVACNNYINNIAFCTVLQMTGWFTILIGLYDDGCTWRTLGHSDCCYCAPICRVRMEGGNCQSSHPICSEPLYCICEHICNIDTVVLDPPIPVLGRWGAPVERQWSRTSCKSCYILWSSSGC